MTTYSPVRFEKLLVKILILREILLYWRKKYINRMDRIIFLQKKKVQHVNFNSEKTTTFE